LTPGLNSLSDDCFVSRQCSTGVSETWTKQSPAREVQGGLMSLSTLIAYDGALTREELALVPTPNGTLSHRPIPHVEVVNALIETLGFRKIGVVKEEYCVSRDGNQFFGTMTLDQGMHGAQFALGIRNSHNKTLALGITVGFKVFVCQNLSFYGDYTPLCKKHTRNFNLKEALSYGIDDTQRNFKPLIETVDRWQNTQVTDVTAKLVIYEAFIEGALEYPKHLAKPVNDYYFHPPHEEFAPRTMWSLQNSFTGAAKTLEAVPLHKATASLARFFESRKL
jgi:hypothetical protein